MTPPAPSRNGERSTTSPAQSWESVLAHVEAEVEAAERALNTGTLERTPSYVPPDGLGPLPPHLHERAWELHDRCRATAVALTRAAGAVAGEIRALEVTGGSRPAAVFVDSRC